VERTGVAGWSIIDDAAPPSFDALRRRQLEDEHEHPQRKMDTLASIVYQVEYIINHRINGSEIDPGLLRR
jgi:hypothetical protein